MKIEAPSGHALLNNTQWFILVTFKDNIPKDKVHKQRNSHHTLSMQCGRYIRIKSKSTQVLLSKINCEFLMELASSCINRKVVGFSRLQDNLVECWNKCLQERSFSTPPNSNGINFDSLFNKLCHKTCLFNKNNPIRMLKLLSCGCKRVHISACLKPV